jgi:hypothetical protein
MADLTAAAMCRVVEAYTANTDTGDALAYVNAGYDRFLQGIHPVTGIKHHWSFLQTLAAIEITSTATGHATGTFSGSPATTLTAGAATFAESDVGRTITFTVTGQTYRIVSFTSTTVVTVDQVDQGSDSGTAFTINDEVTFDLPADFDGLLEPFVYVYNDGISDRPPLEEASVAEIFQLWRDRSASTTTPYKWAIIPKAFAVATGQRWQVIFAPTPKEDRVVRYVYMAGAAALTDSASVYCRGGVNHARTIQQAALANAELITGRRPMVHEALYKEMMAASIEKDADAFDHMGALSLAQGL